MHTLTGGKIIVMNIDVFTGGNGWAVRHPKKFHSSG